MINLSEFTEVYPDVFIFKKWNWDYMNAHDLQLELLDYVIKNKEKSFFIITNHPNCFTLGRGLQKIKETTKIDLVDFDSKFEEELKYPLYKIKRGGGLTFHYSGQFVCYPILNVTHHKIAVHDFMLAILDIVKEILEEQFQFETLEVNKDLLGLWYNHGLFKNKIASIGLAVSRFVTYHGVALNFLDDLEMFNSFSKLHPCGLPSDVYQTVEYLSQKKLNQENLEKFSTRFEEKILHYLIKDKQTSSSLINASTSAVL